MECCGDDAPAGRSAFTPVIGIPAPVETQGTAGREFGILAESMPVFTGYLTGDLAIRSNVDGLIKVF